MPYCDNCGNELLENSKFCPECGQAIKMKPDEQKTSYKGEIHKCPNCGEVLNSFVSNCPSCGYEIRGISSTNSINDFFEKIESASSEKAKMEIIKNFPIPNAKEDILEFMIHAVTNIDADVDNLLVDAWVTKTEQAYQKAQIIFSKEKEFSYIESAYAKFKEKLNLRNKNVQKKNKQKVVSSITSILPSIMFVAGWLVSVFILIPLCEMNLDNVGINTYQLILTVDLILGAVFIPYTFKCGSIIPKIIALMGMIMCVIFMVLAEFEFLLINGIVCSIVIFVRMLLVKNKDKESHVGFKTTIIVLFICLGLLLGSYGVGNAILFSSFDTFEWSKTRYNDQLPEPPTSYGKITDNVRELNVELHRVSIKEYQDYVYECKKEGYEIQIDEADDAFCAYNAERYKLNVSFNENEKTMEICLYIPHEIESIKWPSNEITKKIPAPKSKLGYIERDTSDSFQVFISGMNKNDFSSYINACKKKGFTKEYEEEENYYRAYNNSGDLLTIELDAFSIMEIYVLLDAKD